MIALKPTSTGSNPLYAVSYESNQKYIGEIYQEVDGMFIFHPCLTGGVWSAEMLEAIATRLKELNAPYEATLRATL